MMRISECTAVIMTFLRYIIFVSTEGILCFLVPNFHAFAPALLADVVWRWRPSVTGAASLPGLLRFLGTSHR